MKLIALCFTLVFFSFSAYVSAGELALRTSQVPGSFHLDDDCRWSQTGARAITTGPGTYVMRKDMSLFCNNEKVVTRYNTSQTSCGYTQGPAANSYHISKRSFSCDMMVSKKSTANVFFYRPQSKYYEAYSNDGVLDKPIIIVGGYDPESSEFPARYYKDGYFGYGFNRLLNQNSGRDLFIINYDDAAAEIEHNADILISVIKEINSAKTGSHPTAIIGYSMGGIVARRALKKMESSGVDHDVSLFISYDSPHLGANIPKAIPDTVNSLIRDLDTGIHNFAPSSLRKAQYYYNSPAARQMLVGSSDFNSATFADFPENPVLVAVTNGIMGSTRPDSNLNNGDFLTSFKITYARDKVLGSWSSDTFRWYSRSQSGRYYDNIPGSYLEQFDTAFDALRTSSSMKIYSSLPQDKRVTFIPTFSALAIQDFPTSIGTKAIDYFATNSPFDKYITHDGSSYCTQSSSTTYSNNLGQNIPHNRFEYGVMQKIICALNEFHRPNFVVPDRSMKVGEGSNSCGPNSGVVYATNVPQSSMGTVAPQAAAFCGDCGLSTTAVSTGSHNTNPPLTLTCN